MSNKICCIFNAAPHYREPIYSLMDKELNCDFYIGSNLRTPIKLMNYNNLNGFKKALKNFYIISNYNWQKGALPLIFKPYQKYIITGEPHCLSTWIILILSRILGKKTFLWTHGWYGHEKGVKKITKSVFYSLANKIFLYGDYAKELMTEIGFKSEKLVPIYNSMDLTAQIEVRKTLKENDIYKNMFHNCFPTIVYVGRIQRSKKIELLLMAIASLKNTDSKCNLLIIGEEVENINIKRKIQDLTLQDNVRYFGPCYEEKILGEFFYNSNLCVVPGDVGLTTMHSFVYGTPVVTHNNFTKHGPEFEAIIPEKTGSFFKEDSIDDLCNKIVYWTKFSSEERKQIRKQCYLIVDQKYNPFKQLEILRNNL